MKFRHAFIKSVEQTTNLICKLNRTSQILQGLGKNCKQFAKILRKFCIGAVQKNAYLVDLKKMLKNASFLAIVAVHTTENEPSKVQPASQRLTPPGSNKQRWRLCMKR